MFVYLFIIVFLFLLSGSRVPRQMSSCVLFLLMLFLCFGYMTGSDWRSYESEYYGEFSARLVEPGYMSLSNFFCRAGVNFWVFHILFKCLFYITFVAFLWNYTRPQVYYRQLCDNERTEFHTQFFCGLMLWVASFGFYLLIDCPFRNMISCMVVIPAFLCLFRKRYVLYYALVLLAISFHYSGLLLLLLPLVKVDNLSTKLLWGIYLAVLLVMAIGGSELVLSQVSKALPPVLQDRILYYEEEYAGSSVFSVGLIPRMLCLWGILKYRTRIVEKYTYGNKIISYCYFYLIICLVYYVFPILFRCALYLAPFYILGIIYALDSMKQSLKTPVRIAWLVIALGVTLSTVHSKYYVPYTNILYHYVMGDMHDYGYRDTYNLRMSPYK